MGGNNVYELLVAMRGLRRKDHVPSAVTAVTAVTVIWLVVLLLLLFTLPKATFYD